MQFLGDNTTHDCSEACNSTRLRLIQLQTSEPVTCGIITQIAYLAMLLIDWLVTCVSTLSLFIYSAVRQTRLCDYSDWH